MPSGKKTKKSEPRTVAVKNLYAENTRLRRLLTANRKQVKYTQRAYEVLRLRYDLAMFRLAAVTQDEAIRQGWVNDVIAFTTATSSAPTQTAEANV